MVDLAPCSSELGCTTVSCIAWMRTDSSALFKTGSWGTRRGSDPCTIHCSDSGSSTSFPSFPSFLSFPSAVPSPFFPPPSAPSLPPALSSLPPLPPSESLSRRSWQSEHWTSAAAVLMGKLTERARLVSPPPPALLPPAPKPAPKDCLDCLIAFRRICRRRKIRGVHSERRYQNSVFRDS